MSIKFKKVMFYWTEGKKNIYAYRDSNGDIVCKAAEDEENPALYELAVKEFNKPLEEEDLEYGIDEVSGPISEEDIDSE